MGERPDIGKMIDEELARGGSPEEGEAPLEVKAGAIVPGREPERAMKPVSSPEAASADKQAKREIWEKEQKERADAFAQLHTERSGRPKGAKDALTDEEMDEVRNIIAQAARENDKIATNVLKEGIAVADESTLHPYDKGLDSLSDKLLAPDGDLYRQALMLFNTQPSGAEAVKALQRKLQERVETLAKATAQKRSMGLKSEPPVARREAVTAKTPPVEDKKKAVAEAMQPFYDDVGKMLSSDRLKKSREAAEKADEKEEKPGFWDKLFGKGKKAA